jgi:phage shock protein PspC (stress-responsive transcriptional regulator)
MANQSDHKRLLRSKTNRVLGGVCGGLGDYFNVDPVVVRIAWVIFSFAGGSGVLAYLIAWAIIPEEGSAPTA